MLRKGDLVTVDGATGEVMLGSVPLVRSTGDADFQQVRGCGWLGDVGLSRCGEEVMTLGHMHVHTYMHVRSLARPPPPPQMLAWADEVRTLQVKANADTPEDAEKARALGAEGIGLCRTEHMFFDPQRCVCMQVCGAWGIGRRWVVALAGMGCWYTLTRPSLFRCRIDWVRRMILAEDKEERMQALTKLFEFQKASSCVNCVVYTSASVHGHTGSTGRPNLIRKAT